MSLYWVAPSDKEEAQAVVPVVIEPGENSFDLRLPLNDTLEALEERLLYESFFDHEVTAKLGDFEESAGLQNIQPRPSELTIQLDETHLSTGPRPCMCISYSFGANGKAEADTEHEVTIANDKGDVEHASPRL